VIPSEDWDAPVSAMALRPYQVEFISAVETAWNDFSRVLGCLATGCGKTVCFSYLAKHEVQRGGRVLILAHTDELLEQAIDKLRRSTGIEADKEKADCRASPYATVVVASIQSMARTNRLLGFSDSHFTLLIVDECHRSLANSYLKVMKFFHFGAESLAEDWVMPSPDMPFQFKARVLGVTATADRGDKRSLGEWFQSCVYDFGLLQAVREGWLVRPVVRNIPLKIDLRGVKKTGGDYDAGQVVARITPFLKQIASELAKAAGDRKLVAFTPSIETARLLAEALCENGIDADFVSGACNNRDEKVAAFDSKPNGSAITCAMLLTEGWDCPSANAICVLRPTKIRALYVQAAGRGTRTLPGVIDGLATKEERLEAIARSAKPDALIIDFLYLSDKLDLIEAADLVATTPELKKAVQATGIEDLANAESVGERDLLASLQKAAAKHARREARTIDPLAMAVSLGDSAIAHYVPETKWDAEPPTRGQIDFLTKQKVDVSKVTCKGLASKLIGRIVNRLKHGLATASQLSFLLQLGVDEEKCSTLTVEEARSTIDAILAHKKAATPTTPPTPQSAPLPAPSIPLGIVTEEW